MKSIILILLLAISAVAAPKGWPKEVQEIKYPSKADNTRQPALYYAPAGRDEPRPLLVGLHTWSSDYRQNNSPYATWCIEHKWNFIHPNFRGPNRRPQATGSELVVADILSAVEFAKKNGAVDETRIRVVFENLTATSGSAPYAPGVPQWTFTARVPEYQPKIDAAVSETPSEGAGFKGFFTEVGKSINAVPNCAVTLKEGAESVALVTAIYHAARTGERVKLPLLSDHVLYKGWMP